MHGKGPCDDYYAIETSYFVTEAIWKGHYTMFVRGFSLFTLNGGVFNISPHQSPRRKPLSTPGILPLKVLYEVR